MNLVLPVVGGLIAASDSLGKTKNKAHFAEISLIAGAETVNIRLADVGEGHHMRTSSIGCTITNGCFVSC